MDSSIVNLREHMLAKVAVEMVATARLHEVLRSCAQATAEGALRTSYRVGVYRLGSGVGHRPGLELALQQIGMGRLSVRLVALSLRPTPSAGYNIVTW